MIRKLLLISYLILMCSVARAEDFSISNSLSKIPGMKTGVAYSALDNKFNFVTTAEVMQWSILSLGIGYAGDADATDHKFVGTITTSLLDLQQLGVTIPIIDLIKIRGGVYGGIGNMNIGDGADMRGNNQFDWGVVGYLIDWKF